MATTVHIPLQILTVNNSNANAFYATKDGTNFDYAYAAFTDNVDGVVYYWGIVPQNLAGTPAWNLVLHHSADSGSGGNVILNISAKDFADTNTIDAALTALETALSLATGTSGTINKDTTSGTNYDSTEAIAAGNWIVVGITRDGDHASDTVGAQWNLEAVVMRVDVA